MEKRPKRKTGFLVRNNHTVATNRLSASNIRAIEPVVLLEPRLTSSLGHTRKRKKKLDNNERKPRRKNKTRTSVKKKN